MVLEESKSILRARLSNALIEVSDRLATDFPEVSMATIYEIVGESREVADRALPRISTYTLELEREARIRLALRTEACHRL